MTDRAALLAAIHAAPDDDAPRLVFADWLDENGHPERAEFIRIQVEMKRERETAGRATQRLDELFVRQRDLFRRPWADVLRYAGASPIGLFSRGWPTDRITMPADRFPEVGPILAEWFGTIRVLDLLHCYGKLGTVADAAALGQVEYLILRSGWGQSDLTDADIERLCRSVHLGRLRGFEIVSAFGRVPRRAFDPLSASLCLSLVAAGLTRLEILSLSRTPIGDDGMEVLVEGAPFPAMTTLLLESVGLTDRGAEALLKASLPNTVTKLQLAGNRFSTDAVRRLVARFGPVLNPALSPEGDGSWTPS